MHGVHADSTLVGSSNERRALVEQIEQDFEASLACDQAKDEQRKVKEQAAAQNERREELRIARENRTPPEPDMKSPHVIIRVRHPELGSISRAFSPLSKMVDVYNWVGSLATLPQHFLLSQTFPHSHMYPDEDVLPSVHQYSIWLYKKIQFRCLQILVLMVAMPLF